jgi:hypothetical protein
MASNCNPPDLHLLCSRDYRRESPHPVESPNFYHVWETPNAVDLDVIICVVRAVPPPQRRPSTFRIREPAGGNANGSPLNGAAACGKFVSVVGCVVAPQIYVHLGPVNVALFGKRSVFQCH